MTEFVQKEDGTIAFGEWLLTPMSDNWWVVRDKQVKHLALTLPEAREYVLTNALAEAEKLIGMFSPDLVEKFRDLIWQMEN